MRSSAYLRNKMNIFYINFYYLTINYPDFLLNKMLALLQIIVLKMNKILRILSRTIFFISMLEVKYRDITEFFQILIIDL